MQENTNMFNSKISKILIDEKNDTVMYFMENGNVISTNLSNIMNSSKDIFKNFKISQKCHELTTSFIKRKKLEKLLNPAIIEGLNDNVDIMEYIRCVKNKVKLPFELEHDTAESSLSLINRLKMKSIARHERELGAKVNIIDESVFDLITSKINKMMSEPKKEKETIIKEELPIISEKQETSKNEQKTIENKKSDNTKKEEKKYSKEEITMIMQKYDKFSSKIKFQKGAIVPVIEVLVSYLKEKKDQDVQNYLDNLLSKVNEIEPIDLMKEKEGKENKYNVLVFDYISKLYKRGIKGINGENVIIADERKYSYYTYLLNRRIEDELGSKILLSNDRIKKIKEEYTKNAEKIELNYFEELLERNKEETIGLRNKLLKAEKYSKAIQDLENNSKNEAIIFLALSEDLKNGVYRNRVGLPTNLKIFTDLREKTRKKIASNELTNPKLLKIIENIENKGIYDQLNNEVVKAKQVQTKAMSAENNLYVCSDLHGQFELYKTMVNQLKDADKLYILGDVIDKGSGGIKILQDILQHPEQIELFVGNHELMMIQALFFKDEKVKQNWIREVNGGRETQEDFLKLSLEEQEKIQNLLLQATVHREIDVNSEKIYLVHAKVDRTTDKKQETVADYLNNGREKELYDSVWARVGDIKDKNSNNAWREEDIGKENVFTVIGHTPTNNNKIEVHDTYAIVDCGATNYGNGCLLRLNDGKTVYFDNVTRCLEQLKDEEER